MGSWYQLPTASTMRRPFQLLAILGALVGMVVVVSVGVLDGANAPPDNVQAVFSVLRTHPEAAPRRITANLVGMVPHGEANELLAQGMLATRTRDSTWVFSTTHQLCLVQMRGASCASKYVARHEGVFLGTFRQPTRREPILHDFLVQGLVPDGVRKVQLVIGSNHKVLVAVRENSFSFESDQPVHVKRLLRS